MRKVIIGGASPYAILPTLQPAAALPPSIKSDNYELDYFFALAPSPYQEPVVKQSLISSHYMALTEDDMAEVKKTETFTFGGFLCKKGATVCRQFCKKYLA